MNLIFFICNLQMRPAKVQPILLQLILEKLFTAVDARAVPVGVECRTTFDQGMNEYGAFRFDLLSAR
jgi:hypothetical protein